MKWHVESKEFPFVLDEYSKVIVELPKTEQGRSHARLIAASPIMFDYIVLQASNGDEDAQAIIDNLEHAKAEGR